MLIRTYRDQFRAKLADLYDQSEVDSFFYLLLDAYTDVKKHELALDAQLVFSDSQLQLFNQALNLLLVHTPVQYIIGQTYFYDGVFKVTPSTLIPRPETEELVDLIITQHQFKTNLKIVDIGTGSGCIAISLAKALKTAKVFAYDVSADAIAVAQVNAKLNQTQVDFVLQDILAMQKLPEKYDIIVSNPPYVRQLEKTEIKANVLEHEPHLALFVTNDNPLIFYKKITELACESLSDTGVLYFEINQYLGPETVNMIQDFKVFKSVDLLKDFYGNDRIVVAKK